MISIDNLHVEFSARPLYDHISFVINDRDRIALVGKNGAGKSTLLKIISGIQTPTSGNVTIPNGTTVGYLPQVMKIQDDTTVRDETRKAFSDTIRMGKKLEAMQQEMAERTDYESQGYMDLVERFTNLHDRYMMLGGEQYEAEMERTLQGLGFSRQDLDRPTAEFSGGWRMRIELAKILLQKPDILLLDEPTNHLDIESIQWLEQYLAQSSCAVVLVSHDRAFINNVTNRTIEIVCGHIEDYKVKYDEYVVLRKERREQQLRAYENQQKEIADTKAFIERFRYQATKAVQVQQRIRQLEKIVPIEVDEMDTSALRLKFPPCLRSGDYPVICEDVEKTYQHLVFENVNLIIKRGEKVAFVGRNGEGKSTLVKCIMSEIPFGGTLKVGHNVQIGYFAQNQAQMLDDELTVFETIDRVAKGEVRLRINDILGAFMFGGEASEKKVKFLSGGERSRLAMIRLLLEPVNFLILDEPTNHLDMQSKDVLKEAIKAFDGTVIVVSHDREFLDGLVDKVYEFGGGKVREYLGGIYDWIRSHEQSKAEISQPKAKEVEETPVQNEVPQSEEPSKDDMLSYAERKERNKKISKLEKSIKEVERKIETLEKRLKELDAVLCSPEGASDMAVVNEYTSTKQVIDTETSRWEQLCEELEELR
ncbi:ABC-F family ATP-binding cassette domain-containing protein [Prevotella sp. PINT]|jgi:ATPase components of ABC transporters with duplicated ATPase domains|uniref:ABC-F family ATP-binding cassette domain-containing protein n=1 Tax=Palleniella intestinalis TaxID=2736291 RepID=UPI0015535071|nr:ABC-F family ATP-binding cassette domain-containing protein [Palleniella intestinalis]NPD80449.1 ABC-F family ATP-binding cassette domain-containing protein [Palleniella intestinalis]